MEYISWMVVCVPTVAAGSYYFHFLLFAWLQKQHAEPFDKSRLKASASKFAVQMTLMFVLLATAGYFKLWVR